MKLSPQQTKMVKAYATAAYMPLANKFKLDYSIPATRIASEVLSRLHFKVKPLAVNLKVFNQKYLDKGRNPENQEEFEEWVKEGAWAILIENHLVPIINEKAMIDLHLIHTQDGIIPPILCDVNDEFLNGTMPLLIKNTDCVMTYEAFPENKDYLAEASWCNTSDIQEDIKEIYGEVKDRCK